MTFKIVFVTLIKLVLINIVNSDRNNRVVNIEREPNHPPFDPNIYDEALDAEECAKQIQYLTLNDTLLMMTCKYLI